MKRIKRTFCAGVLLGAGSLSAFGANFTVNVTPSACGAGALVAAIVFGPQGPDPIKTQVAIANGSGVATFSGLTTTDPYQFVVGNAGCTPTQRDQTMDPNNIPTTITDGGAKTIAMANGAIDGTVTMNVKLPSGVFPKFVMGGCNIAANNVQAGYAIKEFFGQTDTVTFFNLRPAPANTYNCNVFSPADNRGSGASVNTILGPGATVAIPGVVDLSQNATPPSSTEGQGSRDGTTVGFPSLSVFLRNSGGTAVTGGQLRLKDDPQGSPRQFTMTDSNGVANFYGLDSSTSPWYLDVIAPSLQGVINVAFSTPSWATTYSTTIVLGALTHPGTIAGTVKVNGANLPNVFVNCHPDFRTWPGTDPLAGNKPGAGDAGIQANTGVFSLTNLVPGNYDCYINSPFSQIGTRISDGPDTVTNTADDMRLTISTAGFFQIYDSSGVRNNAAIPLVINIPIAPGATGTITGTLTFPDVADLTSNPVTISAYEQTVAGSTIPPRGGVGVVQGIGKTQTYSIPVPPGAAYRLQIQGITYGPVDQDGDKVADLGDGDSVTGVDFTMAKAGAVQVTMLTPNGSRWLPVTQPPAGQNGNNFYQTSYCGGYINAQGRSVRAWNSGSVDQTGQVNIAGLPAGTYQVQFNASGAGCTVTNTAVDNVVIAVGGTTNVSVTVKNGIPVGVTAGAVPPGTVTIDANQGGQTDGELLSIVVAYPKGTPLSLNALRAISGNGIDPNLVATLVRSSFTNINNLPAVGYTLQNSGGGPGQSAPKLLPGDLTFYLFASLDDTAEFRTLLGKTNAIVDAAHSVASTIYGSSAVPVAITSTFGSATITGKINGAHMFTKDDFTAAGGDSNKIFQYIPICAVYDQGNNLLGYADGIPPAITQIQKKAIDASIQNNDVTTFLNLINSFQFGYTIQLLPSGNYTLACTTPNYPPVVNNVTLAAGQSTTQDIDFDKSAGAGGTISGIVQTSLGVPLPGATVEVRTKTTSKTQTTASDGTYAFPNLSDGIYRMQTTYPGYASATDKTIIQNASPTTVNFGLVLAPGSVTGLVYASVFPNKVLAVGAKVYAYDDTINGARLAPDAPHWITTTDSGGRYLLPNPTPGDVIKIFATTDGKFPVGTQVNATAGSVTASDINLTAIPPTPTVLVKPLNSVAVDISLESPKLLAFLPILKCSAGATYNDGTATTYTMDAAPDNLYEATDITLPAAQSVCRIITDDGIKTNSIDTVINLATTKEQSNNTIRDEAFGGSIESNSDSQGSSIDFPIGSIVTASGTIPIANMTRTSTASITLEGGSQQVLSDAFQLQTDANLQLGNGKGLDVTLPVSREAVPDINSLRLAQIVNGVAIPVNSSGYYDPLTGRFTVTVQSLTSSAQTITSSLQSTRMRGMAPFAAGAYAYSHPAAAAQSGSYVLIGTPAGAAGAAYAGTTLGAYNFPNPFNLQEKTLTLSDLSTLATKGTIIRYNLPAGNGGHVRIRIFTVSGELVRVLDEGNKTGGLTYYTTWDGKNKNGSDVATGVYLGVFDIPGLKAKDHVIKMAVLK